MTEDILGRAKNKGYHLNYLDKILDEFVDSNGICRECGQNHRLVPNFDYEMTNMDTFSELLQTRQKVRCTAPNYSSCRNIKYTGLSAKIFYFVLVVITVDSRETTDTKEMTMIPNDSGIDNR